MEIIERIKAILLNPKQEWEVIQAEDAPHSTVFTKYLLILALIPTLAFFAKEFLQNRSMLNLQIEQIENSYNSYFNSSEISAERQVEINKQIEQSIEAAKEKFPAAYPFNTTKWSIIFAVCLFAIIVGGAYISAAIINALSNQFDSEKDFNRAFSLVAYSLTPLCIAGILYIFNSLASLVPLIGLYGIYLLYLGAEPLLKPSVDKKNNCFLIAAVAVIGVWLLLARVAAPEIQQKIMTEEYISIQKEANQGRFFDATTKKGIEKMVKSQLEGHKY